MFRAPMSDDHRAKLRAASKAWQRKTGHGTRLGNLRAKKARESRRPPRDEKLEERKK